MNRLNEELKKTNDITIEKIFCGSYQKQFKCICGKVKLAKKHDKFFIMNLPTISFSYTLNAIVELTDCLKEFTKETRIEWPCDECNEVTESKMSLLLTNLPNVLVIRLKTSVDSNCSIDYPLELDMKDYSIIKDSTIYDLIGVINHFGSSSGGHCKYILI